VLSLEWKKAKNTMTRIPISVVGGEYNHPSTPFDAQQTINMFPEVGGKQSLAPSILRRWPGLKLFKDLEAESIGTGAIRPNGMYEASNNRVFVIRGTELVELDSLANATVRGSLGTTTGPVSMTDNGVELVIADGTNIYSMLFTTNALITVLDPDAPNSTPQVQFVDGYVFGFNPDAVELGEFQHSDLRTVAGANDWSTIYKYNAESSPDKLISLIVNGGKVWVFGSKSYEVWYNTGAATGTWNRLQGSQNNIGCGAQASVAQMSGRVFWLGASKEGRAIVYMSGQGYSAQEISTKPLENWINSIDDPSDAVGFTMQVQGHFIYVLTFQTGNRTYCFDMTTSSWFRIAYRNTGNGEQQRSRIQAHAFAFNKNLVGDFSTGLIYELDDETYTDNGDPQLVERYFPYVQSTKERMFWHSLQIDIETGVGLTNDITFNSGLVGGSDPEIQLRWSDDGGRKFGNWHEMSIGKIGEYNLRVKINRLGTSRDRVYHLRCAEPVRFNVLDDAIAEVTFGNS